MRADKNKPGIVRTNAIDGAASASAHSVDQSRASNTAFAQAENLPV
jgi:hypothetical protein